MTQSHDCASTAARRLYDNVWSDVGIMFFNTERLADWQSWRHRFDEEIVDVDSATRCIDLMLESLGEVYTRRVPPSELAMDEAEDRSNLVEARVLEDGIGYLRIASFDSHDIADQVERGLLELVSCEALVIDLRGNTGGLMDPSINCCELVIEKSPVITLKIRRSSGVHVHEVYLDEETFLKRILRPDGTVSHEPTSRRRCLRNKRPIVLLINRRTGSMAEVVAAATLFSGREDGSVVAVGKPSHGKGIGQQYMEYEPGPVMIAISQYQFVGPDDVWFGDCGQTVRNGIAVDEEVDGEEEQLQAAIRRARCMVNQTA